MRLDHATWMEVEAYLKTKQTIIIPVGSTEQHGPMGLIGTDALCAEKISQLAGQSAAIYVAPTLAFTPAPFNMKFPGTISLSPSTFELLVSEIAEGLVAQGFCKIYFLNAHGANLAILHKFAQGYSKKTIRIRSWWEFEETNKLRLDYFGDWEGMHATPSEISITQETSRRVSHKLALDPPRKLSMEYIKVHAGDKHGSPEAHRRDFPDGRVGSHSALANTENGKTLLETAAREMVVDLQNFEKST